MSTSQLSAPQLGTVWKDQDGRAVSILIPKLVEGRLLITGNSGSGKSRTLRRIIEQTYGRIQQIILDPEDEFYTLREKFDFVLTGAEGADCPTSVASAEGLAAKIMELNLSAVIGLADMDLDERLEFIALFLGQIMRTPRAFRRPLLVVVDEADIYAPEGSKSDAAKALINLCIRGRKRGFVPVLATQRPAMLAKSASSACVNKLVGRQSEDIDIDRSAKNLGMRGSKKDSIRLLEPGQFFAAGPGFDLNTGAELVRVGDVVTTHPTAGMAMGAPPPPRSEVAKILAQLASLGEEKREVEPAVVSPKREIERVSASPEELQAARLAGRKDVLDLFAPLIPRATELLATRALISHMPADLAEWFMAKPGHAAAFALAEGVTQLPNKIGKPPDNSQRNGNVQITVHADQPLKPATARAFAEVGRTAADYVLTPAYPGAITEPGEEPAELDAMERRVLTALAQHPEGLNRMRALLHAGYSRSSHTNSAFATLLRWDWARSDGALLKATGKGLAKLGNFERLPMGRELFTSLVSGDRLSEMEKKMLRAVKQMPGRRGEVLAAAGYARSSHTNKAFARLLRYGYVVQSGTTLRLSGDLQ